MRVGDLIPGLTTFRLRDDDAAPAQAGEVVRHVRPGEVEVAGKLSRVTRLPEEGEQDAGSSRVGHRSTQPVHDVHPRGKGQHTVTIQHTLT